MPMEEIHATKQWRCTATSRHQAFLVLNICSCLRHVRSPEIEYPLKLQHEARKTIWPTRGPSYQGGSRRHGRQKLLRHDGVIHHRRTYAHIRPKQHGRSVARKLHLVWGRECESMILMYSLSVAMLINNEKFWFGHYAPPRLRPSNNTDTSPPRQAGRAASRRPCSNCPTTSASYRNH